MVGLKALLFDLDGTLAETEELHREAFNRAFAEAGLPFRWDRALYGELLWTAGGRERIATFLGRCGDCPSFPPGPSPGSTPGRMRSTRPFAGRRGWP